MSFDSMMSRVCGKPFECTVIRLQMVLGIGLQMEGDTTWGIFKIVLSGVQNTEYLY